MCLCEISNFSLVQVTSWRPQIHIWGHIESFLLDASSRLCWVMLGRAAALGRFMEGTCLQSLEGWLLMLQNCASTLKVPIWSLMDRTDDVLGTGMT